MADGTSADRRDVHEGRTRLIVGTNPRIRQIVLEVWKPLTFLLVWDILVTASHYFFHLKEPPLPMPLFGAALTLFLGFRTNAAYARWWEARGLWGSLINSSRSLARITVSFTRKDDEDCEKLRESVILHQITFAHVLRCQLRGQDPAADVERILGETEIPHVMERTNRPNALLEDVSVAYGQALDDGIISPIQQTIVERTLTDIANAQGGMERIKNTPLPSGFRAFPNIATRVFCLFLPIELVTNVGYATPLVSTLIGMIFLSALRIAEDLSDPFANDVHDVPLSAMCRTIEIDLKQTIGREAPEPMEPIDGVLW
jgi:putative membrane protein